MVHLSFNFQFELWDTARIIRLREFSPRYLTPGSTNSTTTGPPLYLDS